MVDDISRWNAEQSERYRRLGDRNDRADVTSGSGYSRYDYEVDDHAE